MRLSPVFQHVVFISSVLSLSRAQTILPTESTTEATVETTTGSTTETTTETTTAIATTSWTAPAIFYPFGSAAGDTVRFDFDDDSFVNVPFSTTFTFFGRGYNSVYVNNNGLLSFKNAYPEAYPPYPFPTYGSEDYIAVLWTELDDYGYGQYSYQEYTSGSVLDRATQDINQYFPNRGFNASWVFVVTWDYVQTVDMNVFHDHSAPAFTAQAVLISDGGNFSFLLMNYGDCAETGWAVEAGYDTVGSTNYYVIHYNPSELQNESNVNVPGRWAFLVNNENIVGLQLKLQSFVDLKQRENIDFVLQKLKEILSGSDGASSPFGLKLRKVQKI